MTAYELFETVLEKAIPGADAVLVNLHIQEQMLALQMEVNAPREIPSEKMLCEKYVTGNGSLCLETEGETEYISLIFPVGGENNVLL